VELEENAPCLRRVVAGGLGLKRNGYLNCDFINRGFSVPHFGLRLFRLTNGVARKGKKLALLRSQITLQEEPYLLEELFIGHRKHSSFVRRGAGCWVLARSQ
jgi:hypothetical protein